MLPPFLDTAAACALFTGLARYPREVAAIAYLAHDWRVLALRHVAGARAWVAVPIRTVARDAIVWEAAGVVVAHNHPSGEPGASRDDLRFTRALHQALAAVGVTLVDQLVVAGGQIRSLRAAGLL